MDAKFPQSFQRIVGELPEAGRLPGETYPYETARPARTGYVERDGVKVWYAAWGESGPWIAFAPIFQMGAAMNATAPHHSRSALQARNAWIYRRSKDSGIPL